METKDYSYCVQAQALAHSMSNQNFLSHPSLNIKQDLSFILESLGKNF